MENLIKEKQSIEQNNPDEEVERISKENEIIVDWNKAKIVVNFLMKENVIACDCEWSSAGGDKVRENELCLVQIGDSNMHVFLFDILVGGADIFEKGGLKELLESKNVLKVFHDCRWDSDILWFKFKVNLSNVFDTQIGYGFWRKHYDNITPFPVGLNTLLKKFAEGNQFKDKGKIGMESNLDYWKKRPMDEIMIQYAREDVLYLTKVYKQLTAAITNKNSRKYLQKLSNSYATQYRKISDQDLITKKNLREKEEKEGIKYIPTYGIKEWDEESARIQKKNKRLRTIRGSSTISSSISTMKSLIEQENIDEEEKKPVKRKKTTPKPENPETKKILKTFRDKIKGTIKKKEEQKINLIL